MTDVKYGVAIGDLTMSASECVRLGPKVEGWGYDSIWMCDHLIDLDGAIADPYALFGYLAAVTEKVFFCAAVSDCQRIHPSKMAHMIATLDEISGGRIGLGIGAGEAMSTIPFGLPFEDDPKIRLERLREYIEVVKLLWSSSSESPVNFSGNHYTLNHAWLDQKTHTKPHPPIYVGALGSNAALRITAELGDGWMPFFSTPGYYTKRLDYLKAHAAGSGRDPESIEPTGWVYLVITDDAELAEATLKELAMFCVVERGSLKHAGFDLSKLPSKEYNFSRLVLGDDSKLEPVVKAAGEIPMDLVKKMHAVGTVQEVTEFFQAQIDAGVRHFIVNPCASPDVDATLEAFSSKVMPRLKKK
jgi:alkanesulfonate monooxygenase SsuD/methylene tetrahydromethanopterin reductase-like flavin-dependent oxidoreductase (luciferase family)